MRVKLQPYAIPSASMPTDGNESNPYSPPQAANAAEPLHSWSPWGIVFAIPLFVYGAIALAFGGVGLLFVPGIFMGGVSIGRDTTLLKLVVWVLFHAVTIAHGYFVMIAASSLSKSQWKRAAKAIGTAAALFLGILIVIGLINCFG
jgi:hypothetical protein